MFAQLPIKEWLQNPALRGCSAIEKAAWVDLLCMFHTSEEPGVLRMPLEQIARAIGADVSLLEGLIRKQLLGGRSAASLPGDGLYEHSGIPLIYAPKHGRTRGREVVLLDEQEGDIYFLAWMLVARHKSSSAQRAAIASGRRPPSARPTQGNLLGTRVQGETDKAVSAGAKVKPEAALRCPYEQLVQGFIAAFPAAPRPRRLTSDSTLGKGLQRAWRRQAVEQGDEFSGYTSVDEGIAKWKRLFDFAATSPFLRGERQTPGRDPFQITLDWLTTPRNLEQIINGKYAQREPSQTLRNSVSESAKRVAEMVARQGKASGMPVRKSPEGQVSLL